jgi:hypothetical protein
MTALVCLLASPHAEAQDGTALAKPAVLMQRAYVDYIWVKSCEERQKHRASFVSSEDFISFAEAQRARAEISAIEQTLRELDPTIDFNALWKNARTNQLSRGPDSFAALMMLGVKSNNERCRYYLDDLSTVSNTVPTLAGADKDF